MAGNSRYFMAVAKKFSCDCKEIGRINKCGHIARWRFNLSLLRAKICRGGAVLAIKFVVLRETCAVTLRRS